MPATVALGLMVLVTVYRAARHVGSIVGAALLLVPLLVGGHHHSIDQTRPPESCPLCMVKAESPAVVAPPVPLLAPALNAVALVPRSTAKLASVYRPFKAGRAPPERAPIHAP